MLKTHAQTHSNKIREVSPLGLNRSAKALNGWLQLRISDTRNPDSQRDAEKHQAAFKYDEDWS